MLDARLVVPPLPPRCVSRPRLLEALDAATERPFTLIAAGPGSGKTVVLTEWARSRAVRPAWISLAPADNDPDRFWSLVVAACHAAGASRVEHGRPDLPVAADCAHVLDTYLAAVGDAQPLLIVLDDAHVLTHPQILAGLDDLMRRGWTRIRLVMSARTDPLLPLHRYRLAGQMSEVRAHDLAMSHAEARDLLAAHDVTLTAHEFAVLVARTEGWAAGLRLSAMSMEGVENPGDFVSEFALDPGSIGEYLMHEVLDRQPEDVRTLLIDTSFLSEVNGDLAAAVTGCDTASETLLELSRTNGFVLPLDRAAGRFRYHQLLREILSYLLRQEPVAHRRELLRRASLWHEQQGDQRAALALAVQGEDWPRAATMLVSGGFVRSFIDQDDLSALRRGELADLVDGSAGDIPLARVALQATARRADVARRELEFLRESCERPLDGFAQLTELVAELMIARALHDHRVVDVVASAIIGSELGDTIAGLRSAVLLEQGSAQFWDGRYDDTDALLVEAYDDAVLAGHVGLQLRCLSQLALVHAFWGRFRSAQNDEDRATVLLQGSQDLMTAPTSLHLAAAMRAFQQANFEAAALWLDRAEMAMASEPDENVRSAVAIARAELLASSGQLGSAQTTLASVGDAGSEMLNEMRLAALADIEVSLGRPNAAVKLLGTVDGGARTHARAYALAQAYLALGDLRKSEDVLRPIMAAVESAPTRILLICALRTQAQIALARRDEAAAVENLVWACELSDGEITLPFLRVSDVFRDLVARHASLASLWRGNVADAVVIALPREPEPIGTRLPEPLTDRERTVLRLLSTTMSTTEIADELCLSVNTVKTHIAAIYRKLATAKRRDAVLRARTLELL